MSDNNKFKGRKLLSLWSIGGLIVALWCCKLLALPETIQHKTRSNKIASISKHNYIPNPKAVDGSNDNDIAAFEVAGLNPKVFKLALQSYNNAKKSGHGSKDILTVVDYTLASTERRMWVIDLRNKKVLFHTLVAHGSGSGHNYATKFSNRPGTAMSSIGMYVTGKIYQGHYGDSLNMHGLEDKFNSNAYNRRIVVHAAHYVDESVISKIGRLGRSWGCLALNKKIANRVMHTIKDGSYIFCYYPDKSWLNNSKFFN